MYSHYGFDRITKRVRILEWRLVHMKSISFVHAADIHLDSPFVGMHKLPPELYKRVKDSTFVAFRNLVNYCLNEKVDFLLISGDLYDGEDRSIRAQIRLQQEFSKLQNANIRVFVIHGNHDHLAGTWSHIEMPENVHIFGPEPDLVEFTTGNGMQVSIAGFSYEKRHEAHNKLNLFPQPAGDLKIGMLHGHDGTSQNHFAYAPFTISDLVQMPYDYWALGHIHTRQILSEAPYVIYPGNIQGRHINETGEKGFIHVEWTTHQQNITFIPCQDIEWRIEKIHISDSTQPDELFQACKQLMERLASESERLFLRIEIHSESDIHPSTLLLIESGQLLELLQEEDTINHEHFVWIFDIKLFQTQTTEFSLAHHPFLYSLEKVIESADVKHELEPLFLHKKASRYLQDVPELEYEQLKSEAKELLLKLLNR